LRHLPQDLVLGTAWYHLYFLLVSMQIYLVFPVILWLVRRTAGHHGLLLTVSGAVQFGVLGYLAYGAPKSGWFEHVTYNADALLPSYQFYVLVGAVAAFHLDRTIEFVRSHRAAILSVAVIVGLATEIFYLVAVDRGKRPIDAAMVLQPAMVPWSLAAVAVLLAVGTIWSENRQPGGRLDRGLNLASDRSFCVFLVHPLVLWLLLQVQARWWHVPYGPALSAGCYLLVLAGSLAFAEAARHTYFSLALTGRRRLQSVKRRSRNEGEDDVRNRAHPAGTSVQAPDEGDHDGDRRRAPDALLH
jgi:peptidoglycan/LPS O-acetylase OafA/YrhL